MMSSLRTAEDDLSRALRSLGAHCPYAEVMAEATGGHALRHDRNATSPEPLPRLEGAVFRAWTGTMWVETGVSGLGRHALDGAAEELRRRLPPTVSTVAPPGVSATGSSERTTPQKR